MKIAIGTYTISSSIIGILFTQLIAFDTRSQVKAVKFSLSLFLALFRTLKLDKISPKRGRLTVISKNWQKSVLLSSIKMQLLKHKDYPSN